MYRLWCWGEATQEKLKRICIVVYCQHHYQWSKLRKEMVRNEPIYPCSGPNLWFTFKLLFLLRPVKAISHANPLSYCPPAPPFYSPTLSSPLHPICANNTPLTAPPHSQQASVEFIQIFWHFASPHFPSRNDLWQLEMGSVGGASSNTLPPFPPSSFFVERLIFSLSTLIFFVPPPLFTAAPPVSWRRPWKLLSFYFFSMWLHSVIDKLGDIPLFVDILCLLSFFVPFAQCPPTVWSCTDTMYGSSEGNPPTAFMWIVWGYSTTKRLFLLYL